MSETKHIVNRIAVNTSGIATENAFQWRAKLASYISDTFPRQLQLILDELYQLEDQVSIDRVELNIDLSKAEGIEQFQRELMQALRIAITKQKQETILINQQDAAVPVPLNRSLDAWFFYLQKGYYPWFHQRVLLGKDLELLIEKHVQNIAQQLPYLLNSFEVQQRFLLGLTESTLYVLLPYFVRVETPYKLFGKRGSIGQRREKEIAKARQVLLKIVIGKEAVDERQFMEMVSSMIDPVQQQRIENDPRAKFQTTFPPKQRPGNRQEEKDTAIWIQNAGLVLLHPFLPVLFDRLLVVNDQRQIINIKKALSLIHYLLYGEEEYSDAKMVLPKIFCGISYSDPIPIDVAINSAEQEECNELVLSVIEYWEALKNTSAKGLLETFVWRRGKLSPGDNGWLLRVENRTEDILLDRLPWSIGYIKLPWMITPLTTEWR
ncbi:contractile injection system tape measure protein [Niabella sp. 22666]|uniref:contractile injection system tape measure protein n=1 Tax=Niabella sp. 22666 TaxID=3453954 RepID=UPI003F84A273